MLSVRKQGRPGVVEGCHRGGCWFTLMLRKDFTEKVDMGGDLREVKGKQGGHQKEMLQGARGRQKLHLVRTK